MNLRTITILTLALVLFSPAVRAGAQGAGVIHIAKDADFLGHTPPTPIAIEGFSGEVAQVLRYDLEVMGFIKVPPDSAQLVLLGSNTGDSVQGQLKSGGVIKLNQIYQSGTVRRQAHRLADDVVLKVTGVNGIAETRIAFKVDIGRASEIYVSDFDGFGAVAATADHNIVAAPCWVPGQFALYYTSYKTGTPNIFHQDLQTGQWQNFAHYNGMNSSAAVSRDGRVAMILSKGGSPDLYVCNADGSGLKQLTTTHEDESSPCWSPDGRWICFAGKLDERRALYKVSAEGGPMQRIPTGVTSPSEPDWSPDGKWIAFTSQMGDFEICVVPAEGGTAVPLTAGEDPSWARNSRNLIFARRSGGNRHLSLLDVPTKQVKDVSRISGSGNSQPSWAK